MLLKARLAGKLDLRQLENQFDELLKKISQRTVSIAREETPIRTGRARRGWTERSNDSGFFVQNSVPYIEQLEKGRSRQAPKGITKPTVRRVAGIINKQRRISR